jgi:hemerythrin-like metal-binding protein
MALLEWRDEFRTGIDGVDYEHENLIAQINEVFALIGDGADRERVIDSLGEIYGSISAHFALEEQMMKRHGYPAYREHKADHDRLLDDIRDISDEFERSDRLDEAAFRHRLAEWFETHFGTHDARLHRMAEMRGHDAVSPSTLKKLIRDARNRLQQRPRR